MDLELLQQIPIEKLLPESAAEKLKHIIETIGTVQRGLYKLAEGEDSDQLTLLKIGTVFQFFFIDILASGKTPKTMTEDDWKYIADKVLHHAVLEDEQSYSEFVFSLYADYIDVSAGVLQGKISEKSFQAISDLASAIRQNTELLHKEMIKETDYVEACLWLSLEAMIKLLSSSLATAIGPDLADLAAAISQLAFEYGRYVLYAKEQSILDKYIQNQYVLDEQLQQEYAVFLEEVQAEADQFRHLIDEAFSPDLPELLLKSAALARAAGVNEKELLTSVEDVDSFFLD